jgi:hypothetical protein
MLSLSNQFLFIHIPKTGGNSVQHIIRCYSEDQIGTEPNQDGFERFQLRGVYTKDKHDDLADYSTVISAEIYDQLFKFCVVRNPWSRCISFYFSPSHWIKAGRSPVWSRDIFLKLLERIKPCADFLKVDGMLQDIDLVIRYERLAEELPEALRRCGIDSGAHQLPHVNRSQAGDYRSYFNGDEELMTIVSNKYQEDIELFGYRFEG